MFGLKKQKEKIDYEFGLDDKTKEVDLVLKFTQPSSLWSDALYKALAKANVKKKVPNKIVFNSQALLEARKQMASYLVLVEVKEKVEFADKLTCVSGEAVKKGKEWFFELRFVGWVK